MWAVLLLATQPAGSCYSTATDIGPYTSATAGLTASDSERL